MSRAGVPRAAPTSTPVAIGLALLLCVVGVIAARDAAIAFGVADGRAWVGPAVDAILGVTVQLWMLSAGVAAGVLGVLLVVSAIAPRRKTHGRTDHEGIWVARRAGNVRASTVRPLTVVVDRVACAISGAAFAAVGLGLIAWQQDRLPDDVRSVRRSVDAWDAQSWDSTAWWKWALAGTAVLTLVVGLAWLNAHRPRRIPSRHKVPAGDETDSTAGTLSVDLRSAARHATAHLNTVPGIRSSTAQIMDVRGRSSIFVTGTLDDSSSPPSAEVIDASKHLRDASMSALDGLAVDVHILLNSRRRHTDPSVRSPT